MTQVFWYISLSCDTCCCPCSIVTLRWSHFFKISKMRKVYQEEKKSLILHGWESREQKSLRNKKIRTFTCFGDRTSGTFLKIVPVSRTKITRSHGPITLWMWIFSIVLHLLVYSLTVAFCTIVLKRQVGGIKIVTVYKRSIFHVEWLIATLIFIIFCLKATEGHENWSTLVKIFVKTQTYDTQHYTCVGKTHQISKK